MSAYIVNKAHIDALMQAGLTYGRRPPIRWDLPESGTQRRYRQLDHQTSDAVGAMLWAENVRSIRARYPDVGADLEGAPGPVDLTAGAVHGYTFPVMSAPRLMPVAILKALDGYEYQTCEHPEWETSEAHAFCAALRRAMIRALPGYEEAAWEVSAPVVPSGARF